MLLPLLLMRGQSSSDFVDVKKLRKGFLIFDNGGFAYINQASFNDRFAQDVDPTEAGIMAVVQKPINQSILAEKSGPPAWKQLPTWIQISENDRIIPPDTKRLFAKQMMLLLYQLTLAVRHLYRTQIRLLN